MRPIKQKKIPKTKNREPVVEYKKRQKPTAGKLFRNELTAID